MVANEQKPSLVAIIPISLEVKRLARNQKYEEALPIRSRLLRLQHFIHEKSLLTAATEGYDKTAESQAGLFLLLKTYYPRLKNLSRLECYDVSNLQAKEATASMVAFTNGLPDKSQYRKFKIKNLLAQADVEMLAEVLKRRFANNWPRPDLIVVDGDQPQVRTVLQTLQNCNTGHWYCQKL